MIKAIKYLITGLLIINFSDSINAQPTSSFFVTTASKVKQWNYNSAAFDKYNFGKAVLNKIDKQFGIPTSIIIDSAGNFIWNVTNSSTSHKGIITEQNDDDVFEFENGKKLLVNVSFKNYDTEMCLTVYGWEKDEYVNLFYKNK